MIGKEEERDGVAKGALAHYARFSEVLGLFINLTMRGDKVVSVRLSNEPPTMQYPGDHPYLTRIIDHIATGKDGMRDIQLDLQVTPFARDVLEQLRKVSPGEVVTYSEIARRLGKPNASRAVGSVCAKNPVTIIVPCHRIVPKSGGIGNYTSDGGPRVKVKLLEIEGAIHKIGLKEREIPAKRVRLIAVNIESSSMRSDFIPVF